MAEHLTGQASADGSVAREASDGSVGAVML